MVSWDGFRAVGGLSLIEASRCHSPSPSALALGLGIGHLMLVSALWWQGERITIRSGVLTTLAVGGEAMVLALALMRIGEPSEMIQAPAACAVAQIAVAMPLWVPVEAHRPKELGWMGDGGWQ
jgi:hypothetical protein